MADGHVKKGTQSVIFLVSPKYYEIDTFDFTTKEDDFRQIENKFLYIISKFDNNGKIIGTVIHGITGNDGILYDYSGLIPRMLYPGEYYFFISDDQIDNPEQKLNKYVCSGPYNITTNTDKIYIKKFFYCKHKIGSFSNGEEMFVKRYGFGLGNEKVVFLIGKLHGNENGAKNSIDIIEKYIKNNPAIVPNNTSVFVLNPASNIIKRENFAIDPKGIDPNRDFLNTKLKETQSIAFFTQEIAKQWSNFTIISAHQYDNEKGQRRTAGIGWVFPLYNLTQEGKNKIKGKPGDYKAEMQKDVHYNNPVTSEQLARRFSDIVKFQYESMWLYNKNNNKAEMYPGEYIYFVSRLNLELNSSIVMIEYEIPISDDKIDNNNTRNGLIGFIIHLLRGRQ